MTRLEKFLSIKNSLVLMNSLPASENYSPTPTYSETMLLNPKVNKNRETLLQSASYGFISSITHNSLLLFSSFTSCQSKIGQNCK